jgi:hypothetical protein
MGYDANNKYYVDVADSTVREGRSRFPLDFTTVSPIVPLTYTVKADRVVTVDSQLLGTLSIDAGVTVSILPSSTLYIVPIQSVLNNIPSGERIGAGQRILGQTFSTASAAAYAAGYIGCSKWVATATGTITTLTLALYNLTTGGKIMMALYADNNTYPGNKLATSREYTISSRDTDCEIHCDLTSPYTVIKGTAYWIAFSANVSGAIFDADGSVRATHGLFNVLAYDSTMPATYPAGGSAGGLRSVGALT